jgi:exosortase/archaeosortase family protein
MFFLWGLGLSVLQAWLEPSSAVRAMTAWLARLLRWVLPHLGIAASVDGVMLTFLGTTQEVTANCLGLAAIVVLAAAVLATPASWFDRTKGFGLGVALISAINVVRLMTFGALLVVSVGAFRFTHVAAWGAFAPLVLLGIWGLWVVRGLRFLPAYPVRLLWRVLLVFPLLLVVWYESLDYYLIAVTAAVNSALTAVGAPIRTASLVKVDVYRYLDVALTDGGVRLELSTSSVTLVALLALVLATPVSARRRAGTAVGGVAILFLLHCASAAATVVLARPAPFAVLPVETLSDFINLSAPGTLWLCTLADRLPAGRTAAPPSGRPSRTARSHGPAGRS